MISVLDFPLSSAVPEFRGVSPLPDSFASCVRRPDTAWVRGSQCSGALQIRLPSSSSDRRRGRGRGGSRSHCRDRQEKRLQDFLLLCKGRLLFRQNALLFPHRPECRTQQPRVFLETMQDSLDLVCLPGRHGLRAFTSESSESPHAASWGERGRARERETATPSRCRERTGGAGNSRSEEGGRGTRHRGGAPVPVPVLCH
mmetsp:Transcript_6041/g.11970  ORF Transcript_6041/g.11970 Transcript_6041/m.11970 type:complete len:200 (-) Transcript_6041:1883-2482(-)